jgi:Protein of unknown function (DUF3306)
VAQKDETFLGRWSRLKHEERKDAKTPPEKPETEAPKLPPVEELTPQSDFKAFMHPKVDQALRRVALKKMFNDPHFNTPDPFEPFSGDWTGGEAISEEMLKTLNQARTQLFDRGDKDEKTAQEKATEQDAEKGQTQAAEAAKDDEPRRENT